MESAMIKMIRRCNDDALYWAYRLSQVSGGNRRIWERLEIMSAEDIGMAYPWLRTYLNQQYQSFLSLSDEKFRQHILLDTVCFFTRQHKSRLCDNIAYVYFKGNTLELSEEETMGLLDSLKENIEKGELNLTLESAGNLYKAQKEDLLIEALKFPQDPESTAIISYFKAQNSVQRNYHDVLFVINLVLYRVMDFSKIRIKFEVEKLDIDSVYADERQLEVPDCAYDYHCTIGRNQGRGYKHYYEEGAKLNQCFIEDPYEPIAKSINIKKDK